MLLTEKKVEKENKFKEDNFAIFIINKQKPKKILDLTTVDWLKNELNEFNIFVVDLKKDSQIKDKILPYLGNFNYFMIIYNNTPYITRNLVKELIEYVSIKESNACKLFSGAIYKTNYFLNTKELVYDNFYMQSQESFQTVEDEKDIALAEKYFTQKIIYKLQKNGVTIENPTSNIISPLCRIGRGSVILNNCIIKGKTEIGENVIINNNVSIINSKIGKSSSISNSIIENSKIGDNVIISPYCNIKKSTIDKNCTVGYYCIVENYKIKKDTQVSDRTTLRKEGDNK